MRRILAFFLAVSSLQAAEPVPLFIEGYAGQRSVAQGQEITNHVSNTEAKFEIEVAWLGAKREVMWKKADLHGAAHPVPKDARTNCVRGPGGVGAHFGAARPSRLPR